MSKTAAPILSAIREKMKALAVCAIIVPTSDSHNSEYVATHLQRRAFMTGFNGSAGTAVVTENKALVWTDGRYWLEAAESLYPEYTLMKQGKLDTPTIEEWLESEFGSSAAVGMDPYVCTVAEWERMSKKIALKPVGDIVGALMAPESSPAKVYVRPAQFCGATCAERRAAIVAELEKHHCDWMVLSALDEIAWLTNLRGADVPYNPVFYSYAVIDKAYAKVRVYVNLEKITDEVRAARAEEIEFFPYERIGMDLEQLAAGHSVLVDERQTSEALFRLMRENGATVKRVVCGPAQKLKACKNEVELQGFRNCHVRDSAALTRYLAWLYDQIAVQGNTSLNEYDAASKLESFRAVEEHFVQLSFSSISSTGPNGAIVHYGPAPTGSAIIAKDQLYLIDSGAQYMDGTTDVTRTICFAPPRPEEIEAYTLVLKGHIALHNITFPKGTSGHRIEVVARQALWQVGLDYAHGTGHGVGSLLNVHEGPHNIGPRPTPTEANVELHNIVSNEPGYYKDGAFGIRIENLEEIVVRPTKYSADGFLGMSVLTVAPLCRELIDASLLTAEEKKWVNEYHAKVAAAIMPHLERHKDEMAIAYLKHHTQPI